MRRRLLLAVLLASAACGGSGVKTEAERTISDPARGVRYVVPQRWKAFDGEARSPEGSLMSLRVYDLVEAQKSFVAALPDSLEPQLLEWAQLYYIVDGEPARSPATVAGIPATEYDYTIRVRPKDPPSKVIYWVVQRKTRLFVIRAAFPAAALAAEEPVMREIVAGWGFLESSNEHEE